MPGGTEDAWPHTRRPLPWLFALFLAMLYLVPFDSIHLKVSLPVSSDLDRHHDWLSASGTLQERRKRRLFDRTREVVDRATRRWVWEETRADQRIAERLDEIVAGRVSPYEVATEVLDGLKQGERI